LIGHQYAKFAARYGILVDSAILKSMIFDDFVDFVDLWTDARVISFLKISKIDFGRIVKSTGFKQILFFVAHFWPGWSIKPGMTINKCNKIDYGLKCAHVCNS
jgi:hypothetical protein